MKRSPHSTKPRVTISHSSQHLLNLYALAASAAGAGLLTAAQPAEAKIVYTPAQIPLMNRHQVFIDLNHDGINDFLFYGISTSNPGVSTFLFRLTVSPARQGNAIWGVESREHPACAAGLRAGIRIGPKRPFQQNPVVLFDWSGGPFGGTAYGQWLKGGGRTAYLGLKFQIKGEVHFGWARVKSVFFTGDAATLTGYAYETIPNKPIVAGAIRGLDEVERSADPPAGSRTTLGLLAAGAHALPVWRRREFFFDAVSA